MNLKYEDLVNTFPGRYGYMHFKYLAENKTETIEGFVSKGTLNEYLIKINEQAIELKERIFNELKSQEHYKFDTNLIGTDYFEYCRCYNIIDSIAEEIVLNDVIYV